MKKTIEIPMGIDIAPFWANLFLYSYEEEYMPSLQSLISSDEIKARHFYSTKRFIVDLCVVNSGVEFGRYICDM